MAMWIAYFLLGVGISLLLLGMALSGWSAPPEKLWLLLGGVSLTGTGVWLQKQGSRWARGKRTRRLERDASPLVVELAPMLYGDYTPYVIEAAEKLGEAQDTTAVPTLLYVLEECVNAQRPGWREVSEALANALARIGDRRALPLLFRLENVRGIGFIPSIRNAIAAIEPQTSLLRPGSADYATAETLLRPLHNTHNPDDARVLLRSTSESES